MKGQCVCGGRPSIDKLLTVLDRYDNNNNNIDNNNNNNNNDNNMRGSKPSIDKLLTVLDRYDWMPDVIGESCFVNTKQDDINFLIISF